MNRRLIFFEGAYDTLDLFAEKLRGVYEDMGFETLVMNAGELKESMGRLMAFAADGADAVITFNNLGFYLELAEGQNLWDTLGIPCINILMDHPFRYHRFLVQAPANGIVLCPDRNHAAYIRRFYPNIRRVGYLPHGGIQLDRGQERKPVADRSIEVLYAGSLSRYAAEGLIPDLGNIVEYDGFQLSREVLEELIRTPERTTEAVIEEYFCAHGVHLPDERLREEIARLRFLDVYATSFFREQAVRYLVEQGISVTVCGQGWSDCDWSDNPNLNCIGVISPEQVIRLMGESRLVLNTMTWFKDGTHDRVFNGMLAGAAVVSDPSLYMQEHFTDREELAFFHLPEVHRLPELVKELLADTGKLQQMADNGYRKALAEHTWKQRAEELLAFLEQDS